MRSLTYFFFTSLLIFIIASIFLPFLIQLFHSDCLANAETVTGPLKLLFNFLADPNLSWLKMLLVIPLAMIWFMVS